LDSRLTPFAGLYVLIMAIVGPVLAVNSERAGGWIFTRRFGTRRAVVVSDADADRDRDFALAEAAMAGAADDELAALDIAASDGVPVDATDGTGTFLSHERDGELLAVGADPNAEVDDSDDDESRIARQAGQQSDHHDAPDPAGRERDPEY